MDCRALFVSYCCFSLSAPGLTRFGSPCPPAAPNSTRGMKDSPRDGPARGTSSSTAISSPSSAGWSGSDSSAGALPAETNGQGCGLHVLQATPLTLEMHGRLRRLECQRGDLNQATAELGVGLESDSHATCTRIAAVQDRTSREHSIRAPGGQQLRRDALGLLEKYALTREVRAAGREGSECTVVCFGQRVPVPDANACPALRARCGTKGWHGYSLRCAPSRTTSMLRSYHCGASFGKAKGTTSGGVDGWRLRARLGEKVK